MNHAQWNELLRLEGDLAASTLDQLRRKSSDWDSYYANVKAAHQAMTEAIAKLTKGL